MTELQPIVWNSLIDHSLEICWIGNDGPTWIFEGAATVVEEAVPFSLNYVLRLDRQLGLTRFDGRVRSGSTAERVIAITGSPGNEWRIEGGDGEGTGRLESGTCIDLGWTPLTNTFSIWRLDLAIGESADIVNAWVPFPEFVLKPAVQRYTRVGERRYRYEQPEIDFTADLDVDKHGFVRRYGDIWDAVLLPQSS